jgi:hypothetical protein
LKDDQPYWYQQLRHPRLLGRWIHERHAWCKHLRQSDRIQLLEKRSDELIEYSLIHGKAHTIVSNKLQALGQAFHQRRVNPSGNSHGVESSVRGNHPIESSALTLLNELLTACGAGDNKVCYLGESIKLFLGAGPGVVSVSDVYIWWVWQILTGPLLQVAEPWALPFRKTGKTTKQILQLWGEGTCALL